MQPECGPEQDNLDSLRAQLLQYTSTPIKPKRAKTTITSVIIIILSRQTKSAVSPLDGIAFRRFSDTHRKEEAHHVLDEVYGWFTEGFETKDLREARELLEEL